MDIWIAKILQRFGEPECEEYKDKGVLPSVSICSEYPFKSLKDNANTHSNTLHIQAIVITQNPIHRLSFVLTDNRHHTRWQNLDHHIPRQRQLPPRRHIPPAVATFA
jgi:hypothetical protein